jgi:hypothetical protein
MRSLFGAVALAAIAVTVVLIGTASAAKPPPPPPNSNCPTSTSNLRDALNVGASYDAGTHTYLVERFGPAAQTSLVKYCVYANVAPSTLAATAVGADGSAWIASKKAKTFSFSRPGGEPTNLALDGTNQPVGTATFAQQLTRNDIVLHISDGGQCFSIYGVVTPTCFVAPAEEPGPVCDAASSSDTNAAYNSIPKDAVDCGPPSHAFEGTQTKEFGNEVVLSKSGNLGTLKVLFNSYACADAPLWNNNQCATLDPNETFTHPITANIYAANADHTVGALLATKTVTQTFPYRPSADPACGANGGDASRFVNTVTGNCEYSKKVVSSFGSWTLTPDYPLGGFSIGNHVIWTVAYATSDYGDPPLGSQPCNLDPEGCPYDSLNVGTKTFTGSPYAGTEADTHAAFINSTWNEIYCDNGPATGFLRVSTNPPLPCLNVGAVNNYAPNAWAGLTPLATIILS